MLATWPVRLTGWPSLISSHSPKSAAPTLSSSRLNAIPVTPCSNSSISIATAFSSPWIRAMPSPTWSTPPTSARSVSTSYCSIRCLRIEVISSGRRRTRLAPSGSCQLTAEVLQTGPDAGVHAVRSGLQHETSNETGVDRARGAQLAVGGAFDPLQDPAGVIVRQLDGGRELHVQDPLLTSDECVELSRDRGQLVGAALLGNEQQKVADRLIGPGQDRAQRVHALLRVDLRVFEQRAQLRNLFHRGEELGELPPDRLELVLLLGGLEQGVRIDALGDGHDYLTSSRAEKSSSPMASSMSRR